jgi:hypothetical protein
MPGIRIGTTLTCDDLFILFYDQCQEPPVATDPYEVFYYISRCMTGYCGQEILTDTVDSVPLRNDVGKYYVPELPSDLEPGKYRLHWIFRETGTCTLKETCVEFVLYRLGENHPIQTFPNSCICFTGSGT